MAIQESEIHKVWRSCVIQFVAVDEFVAAIGKILFGEDFKKKNPYFRGPSSNHIFDIPLPTKVPKLTAEAVDPRYVYYRTGIYLLDLLSICISHTDSLCKLKEKYPDDEKITELAKEIAQYTNQSPPIEIVWIIRKLIESLGNLADQEETCVKLFLEQKYVFVEKEDPAPKDPYDEMKPKNILAPIKSARLEEVFESVSKLSHSQFKHTHPATLVAILNSFTSLLEAGSISSSVLLYAAHQINFVKRAFATAKNTPSQAETVNDARLFINFYIDEAITPEQKEELTIPNVHPGQLLKRIGKKVEKRNSFQIDESPYLHLLLWWLTTEKKELSVLYRKVKFHPKLADDPNTPKAPKTADGKSTQDEAIARLVFPGSLVSTQDGIVSGKTYLDFERSNRASIRLLMYPKTLIREVEKLRIMLGGVTY